MPCLNPQSHERKSQKLYNICIKYLQSFPYYRILLLPIPEFILALGNISLRKYMNCIMVSLSMYYCCLVSLCCCCAAHCTMSGLQSCCTAAARLSAYSSSLWVIWGQGDIKYYYYSYNYRVIISTDTKTFAIIFH